MFHAQHQFSSGKNGTSAFFRKHESTTYVVFLQNLLILAARALCYDARFEAPELGQFLGQISGKCPGFVTHRVPQRRRARIVPTSILQIPAFESPSEALAASPLPRGSLRTKMRPEASQAVSWHVCCSCKMQIAYAA